MENSFFQTFFEYFWSFSVFLKTLIFSQFLFFSMSLEVV